MKIETNISITDLIITKTGSIDNLVEFISENGLENVDQDIVGLEIEVYNRSNVFSESLRQRGIIASTREDNFSQITQGFAFDSGFDEGFDTE